MAKTISLQEYLKRVERLKRYIKEVEGNYWASDLRKNSYLDGLRHSLEILKGK